MLPEIYADQAYRILMLNLNNEISIPLTSNKCPLLDSKKINMRLGR